MPNVEEHLRKAMEEGKFDDLPGKGKPLKLEADNPHADPEWELAYRMLKEAGYSLPWIETIRDIEREIEAARADLQQAWDWHRSAGKATPSENFVNDDWERSQELFKEKLGSLNQRIRNYNLEVPIVRFQRPLLNLLRELEKIQSG